VGHSRCSFGPSADEIAAKLGSARRRLLSHRAPEHSARAADRAVRLALGLLTQAQLDRVLAKPTDGVPLGEALVAARLISQFDLQAVIAHKIAT
jgi:hypothetical protein